MHAKCSIHLKFETMRNIFLILALSLLSSLGQIQAQNSASIRGRIVDEKGLALPMASVITEVHGKTIGAVANAEGYFILKPLPEGKYNITASYLGFANHTIKGIEVSNNQTYSANVIRLSNDTELPEVVIATRKLIDSDQTITKLCVKATELESMPTGRSLSGILRAISSDISIDKNNKVILRGSRPGNSITIVDDVKSMGDASVPSSAIASVTVYSGGIPAKYGDFTGGVVLIQTKSYFDYYYKYKD